MPSTKVFTPPPPRPSIVVRAEAELLRLARERQGLTMEDLARRADVSLRTIQNVHSGLPITPWVLEKLALALGMTEHEFMRVVQSPVPPKYQSVFISYGGPDEAFARLLYKEFQSLNIRSFFFPESAVPGKRLHRTMSQGVIDYDRVLLICSKSSLNRKGVLNEIEQVLTREANEGGTELLIPIMLDEYVINGWNPKRNDIAVQIKARVIADFRGAQKNPFMENGSNHNKVRFGD